ncbi:mycofactocin biosynthesis peptidyl-dipeptidase MftE [Pseudarthrobacter sp. AG30]|uniref:mycofactocin biosynthesis peptidyl-dipeptidase MftE n=1 Tax=Pseudarthrobacter sp. AG30 TaxID=2249742 RepID=UPI000D6DD6F2|nr:mycofactocin biosynthesis peptidyl-dipeptidase MftE [Pseudarthrobacter sp. AG30]RAX15109.1 mycofactocin biosynthesis peptidyl-dipeptidase MftE [Pseudarthrobacter sp. AG30]
MTISWQELGDLAWPDIHSRPMVMVPVGSTEQHGPHLPLDTDTVIATAVTIAVADAVSLRTNGQVLVAPAISYGSSGEHESFAGTASIGFEALRFLVVELVRSLSAWCGRVVLVNAHGGNVAAVSAAVRQLRAECHDVAWLPCVTEGGDLHAGRVETSLMLHLSPDTVRLERAVAGDIRPLADILPELKAHGVRAVSPSGVLGDPAGASVGEGQRSLELMVEDAFRRLTHGVADDHGMLAVDRRGTVRVPA